MTDAKPSKLFWVVAVVFLLWSIMGCAGYLAEHMMSDDAYREAYGEAYVALRGQTPMWATAGYAIGVWGGLTGAILLLLRKKLCLPFFVASLAGAIVGFIPSMAFENFRAVMGPSDWGMMCTVWAICIFIIAFAHRQKANTVLR